MKEGYGVCPVCNGTGRESVTPELEKYKRVISGYDEETDTFSCRNCGTQYMFGKPLGIVPLNKEGNPCTHSYTIETVGKSFHKYYCKHCGDTFHVDSGD